jgi:hypothetical protein
MDHPLELLEHALLVMLARAPTQHTAHDLRGDYCARCVTQRLQCVLWVDLLSGCVSDPGTEWN